MELSSFEQFAILEQLLLDYTVKITDVMDMFIKMFNKSIGNSMAGNTTLQCLILEDAL